MKTLQGILAAVLLCVGHSVSHAASGTVPPTGGGGVTANIVYVNGGTGSDINSGALFTNALKAASSGFLLSMSRATYDIPESSMPLVKNGVDQWWPPGSRMIVGRTNGAFAPIFSDENEVVVCNIMGHLQLYASNETSIAFYLDKTGTKVHAEMDVLHVEGLSGDASAAFLLGTGAPELILTVRDYAKNNTYDLGFFDPSTGAKARVKISKAYFFGDMVELNGDAPAWGNVDIDVDYAEQNAGSGHQSYLQLAGRCKVRAGYLKVGGLTATMVFNGSTNGLVHDSIIESPENAQWSLIQPQIPGGKATGGWLSRVTLIGGTNVDVLTLTNSAASPLELDNCTIRPGWGSTNWARGFTPAFIVAENLTIATAKPLGSQITLLGTNWAGSLNVGGPVIGAEFSGSRFIQTNGFNFSMKHGWLSTNLQWRLVKTITLTNVVDVSACAYYPSNNSFWTVHNNSAGSITEWTLDGVFLRHIDGSGSGLTDCESITYLGGNKFAVVEEDLNNIYVITITNNATGSTWTTNNSEMFELPSSIGTDAPSGVEGIAYDWDRKLWWIAKEKSPAQLIIVTNDAAGAWFTNNWFTTAQMQTFTNTTHTDFSDIFLDRANQVLWVAQDEGGQSDRIIGISLLTSNIITTISCTNFGQLEGVSVTPDGYVLAAGEANQFAIFEPVIGGLNSGMGWQRDVNGTNSPSAPFFPGGLGVGTYGVFVTNQFATNITLNFPAITAASETNLSFAFAGAAAGDEVVVNPPDYTAGVMYSGMASNGVIYVIAHNYGVGTPDPASGSFNVSLRKFKR